MDSKIFLHEENGGSIETSGWTFSCEFFECKCLSFEPRVGINGHTLLQRGILISFLPLHSHFSNHFPPTAVARHPKTRGNF